MAYWGVAMSHYHGLWHNGDTNACREALHKGQEIARHNTSTRAGERAYIDALVEIYKEDGKDEYAHAQAYEQKIGALQAACPDDNEAAILPRFSTWCHCSEDGQDVFQPTQVRGDSRTDLSQAAQPSRRCPLHHSLLRQSGSGGEGVGCRA